jgi:hypothetical protein
VGPATYPQTTWVPELRYCMNTCKYTHKQTNVQLEMLQTYRY